MHPFMFDEPVPQDEEFYFSYDVEAMKEAGYDLVDSIVDGLETLAEQILPLLGFERMD